LSSNSSLSWHSTFLKLFYKSLLLLAFTHFCQVVRAKGGQGKVGDQLSCDEYPYASAKEGGLWGYLNGQVSISLVPEKEQSFQGGNLDTFYSRALAYRPETKFGVNVNLKHQNSYFIYFINGNAVRVDLPPTNLYPSSMTAADFDTQFSNTNKLKPSIGIASL
jgi:hypothetical protein